MRINDAPGLLAKSIAALAFAGVAAMTVVLVLGMNRAMSVVRIEGDLSGAERDAVQRAIAGSLEQGYLALDLDGVAGAVLALSWPREVLVRRVWPSVLHIEVRKEAVTARWGVHAALSSSGEIIEVPQPLGDDLPLFECVHADGDQAMRVYRQLRDGLRSTDLEIAALEENDFGEWRMKLENGIVVVLGRDDLTGRLERFVAVYRGSLEQTIDRVAAVDARYGNGVAVSWVPDSHREDGAPPRSDQLARVLAVTGR